MLGGMEGGREKIGDVSILGHFDGCALNPSTLCGNPDTHTHTHTDTLREKKSSPQIPITLLTGWCSARSLLLLLIRS